MKKGAKILQDEADRDHDRHVMHILEELWEDTRRLIRTMRDNFERQQKKREEAKSEAKRVAERMEQRERSRELEKEEAKKAKRAAMAELIAKKKIRDKEIRLERYAQKRLDEPRVSRAQEMEAKQQKSLSVRRPAPKKQQSLDHDFSL